MSTAPTVFDNTGYNERAKSERVRSPKPRDIEKDMKPIHRIWDNGFREGYRAAIERYISLQKK